MSLEVVRRLVSGLRDRRISITPGQNSSVSGFALLGSDGSPVRWLVVGGREDLSEVRREAGEVVVTTPKADVLTLRIGTAGGFVVHWRPEDLKAKREWGSAFSATATEVANLDAMGILYNPSQQVLKGQGWTIRYQKPG